MGGRASPALPTSDPDLSPVTPFSQLDLARRTPISELDPNIPLSEIDLNAEKAPSHIWNRLPGMALFDYDRDGDLDFYVTSEQGRANVLYQNEGQGTFVDAALEAGVEAVDRNGTGAAACDLNNDGYQDLYVGARGTHGDFLVSARLLKNRAIRTSCT